MNTGDERVLRLIRPEYLECVPSFVRQHAAECVCQRIAREYPELYAAFSRTEEPDAEARRRMAEVANRVFLERMKKRRP